MRRRKGNRGISLVEVVVGSSIILIVFIGLISVNTLYIKAATSSTQKIQAAFLIEEGLEAARLVRDTSWTSFQSLSTTTSYHLAFDSSASTWKTTTTVSLIDSVFDRTMNISDVLRDGSNNIASTGTYDQNIKKVTVSVAWYDNTLGTTTQAISTFFANVVGN